MHQTLMEKGGSKVVRVSVNESICHFIFVCSRGKILLDFDTYKIFKSVIEYFLSLTVDDIKV